MTMNDEAPTFASRVNALANLLHQTAEVRHIAYQEADGVDPDWSIWYAGRLLEQGIEKLLDATLLKSDLIYLLVLADKTQNLDAPGAKWERYYADFLLRRYLK